MRQILSAEATTCPRLKELLAKTDMKQPKPGGCPACDGKGYRGRLGVFELMIIDDPIKTIIHQNPDEVAISHEALQRGMTSMRADSVMKVLDGLTDIAEVERMVGPLA
jgi:general secretion pathway protein E